MSSDHVICEAIHAIERIVCGCHHHKKSCVTRVVTYGFKGITFQAQGDKIMLTVKVTEVPGTVDASVTFKDAEGNPTEVDATPTPTWVASDPSIVDSIVVAADGLSAKLHIANAIGSTQVTLTASENGVSTDYVDTVSVIAGDAVAADFVFSGVTPD